MEGYVLGLKKRVWGDGKAKERKVLEERTYPQV